MNSVAGGRVPCVQPRSSAWRVGNRFRAPKRVCSVLALPTSSLTGERQTPRRRPRAAREYASARCLRRWSGTQSRRRWRRARRERFVKRLRPPAAPWSLGSVPRTSWHDHEPTSTGTRLGRRWGWGRTRRLDTGDGDVGRDRQRNAFATWGWPAGGGSHRGRGDAGDSVRLRPGGPDPAADRGAGQSLSDRGVPRGVPDRLLRCDRSVRRRQEGPVRPSMATLGEPSSTRSGGTGSGWSGASSAH